MPLSPEHRAALTAALGRAAGGEVTVTERVDPSIVGGVVARVGSVVYDGSVSASSSGCGRRWRHRDKFDSTKFEVRREPRAHMQIKAEEISKIIRDQIGNYSVEVDVAEVGTVISCGDGIARIHGVERAMAGEMLEFPHGLFGIALNLEEESVGSVLLGHSSAIKEGDQVKRTGRIISVPVGEEMIGRVVNALGQPIDGKGPIAAKKFMPIERIAPGVVDRSPVKEPLQTGLKAIDGMVPIGRGQRELIIGDRQTGKTAVAVDAIINQKGLGVICIYNAIGQKQSTVAQVVQDARRRRRDGIHHRRCRRARRTRRRCSTSARTRPARLASSSATAAVTRCACTTTCRSTRSRIARSRCCCAARRAARRIPATSSTCTPVCWSARPSSRPSSAADR